MEKIIYVCFGMIPVYLLVTYAIFKVIPASLSETYYLYKNKFGIKWPFKALLWTFIATIMPVWFEASDGTNNNITYLAFLSCVSLGSVAIAAEYLGKDEKKHQIFTTVAFILSLLWSILVGQYSVPLWLYIFTTLFIALGMAFSKGSFTHRFIKMKGLLCYECAAFYVILFSLLKTIL